MANKSLILFAFFLVFFVGCSQINFNPFAKVNVTPTPAPEPAPVQNQTNQTNVTVTPPPPPLLVPPTHFGNLTIYYINVGQGESEFIIGPNNKTLLIDCGSQGAASTVVDTVRNLGFATVDALVISRHQDEELGGCPVEIFKLKPSLIYDNGHAINSQTYRDYLSAASNNTRSVAIDGPFEFDLISSRFIVPYDDGQGFAADENDNSVLIRMLYKNVSFLFTGGCQSDCEARVINTDVSANVLKVGLSGSKTASSILFLNSVKPTTAVISVGTNQNGYPNQETLDKLNQRNIQIYRTDQDGTVVITTDGSTIGVEKVK